jgi:hypothetical protein
MLRFYREPEEDHELQSIDKDLLMKLRMPQVLVCLSIHWLSVGGVLLHGFICRAQVLSKEDPGLRKMVSI